jgi:RpiR family carbohydrate utilization transcriptional regulator
MTRRYSQVVNPSEKPQRLHVPDMATQTTPKRGAGKQSVRQRSAATTLTASAVLSRIHNLYPSLGAAGQRIADYIVTHSGEVVHMSVTEVAENASASEGSVVGFCKRVGATGFQQLKILLAQETVRPVQLIQEDLQPDDDADIVIRKLFQSNLQTLRDTQANLDVAAVRKAVTLIKAARRIEIYGVGTAACIAEDAQYRMLRIGLDVKVVIDPHIQAVSAALTGPDVAVLTVSHSGSTHETVTATKLAREAGARTICITNFGKSPIQAFAEVVLFTMARETNFTTEAMTSRLAQLAIIDVLIACLALTDYDRSVRIVRRTYEVLSLKRY